MASDQASGVVEPDDATNGVSDETEETDEYSDISTDDLFHVLQNERRRRVLKYLVTNGDGPFEMRTIAEHVAAEEHGTTVQALTSDQRQRVYIALYQSHLPKLDEKGFIDYNQSRGVVEKHPLVEETAEHLTELSEEETATDDDESTEPERHQGSTRVPGMMQKSFAGASTLGVLMLLVAWTSSGFISGLAVAAVAVAMLTALSAVLIRSSK